MRQQNLVRQKLRAGVGKFAAGVAERELPRKLSKQKILWIVELSGTKLVPGRSGFFQAPNLKRFEPAPGAAFEDNIRHVESPCFAKAQHFAYTEFVTAGNPDAVIGGQFFGAVIHDKFS